MINPLARYNRTLAGVPLTCEIDIRNWEALACLTRLLGPQTPGVQRIPSDSR